MVVAVTAVLRAGSMMAGLEAMSAFVELAQEKISLVRPLDTLVGASQWYFFAPEFSGGYLGMAWGLAGEGAAE